MKSQRFLRKVLLRRWAKGSDGSKSSLRIAIMFYLSGVGERQAAVSTYLENAIAFLATMS